MVKCNNLLNNPNLKHLEEKGSFIVLEYQRDLSVSPHNAVTTYYMSEMGVKKRQVLAQLNGNGIVTQAGAMQWTTGSVHATTGVKGVGDLFGKALKGKMTGESAIKPEYVGNGMLMLELRGQGIVVLESNVPREELIEFQLEDDELKIDGNMAVAWSESLKFTVERSGKTLIGSAASGEGLVNVYRGTGKVLMSPISQTSSLAAASV